MSVNAGKIMDTEYSGASLNTMPPDPARLYSESGSVAFRSTDGMSDCIETTWRRNADGYGQGRVNGVQWKAHRWAWTQTHGPIPAGLYVLHHCDNPPCVNPAHLFLGTQQDNVADMHAKGRDGDQKGARNGRAKISEVDALAIRRRSGEGTARLAAEFGLSPNTIREIVAGARWSHLR